MKRLFVALKIVPDADFLAKYRNLRHDLGHEHIKWVEEHNIHITLKFFGETEVHKIPGIISVLGNRASLTRSFELRLSGIGIFGSSYAPRVVWVGIEPYDQLSVLMKSIHADLGKAGFAPDRQNLVPHLTLGRIKQIGDKTFFNHTIDHYRAISSVPLHIPEAVLYESILHREGPEYLSLEKFPFLKKELP